MTKLKFDVFGKLLLVIRTENGWQAYYLGPEGKKRTARDIILPEKLKEAEISQYLDDLCHEWANLRNSCVRRID